MTIQFSCEKLMLSPSSFELLGSPDRIGIAVVRKLLTIDLSVRKLDLTPYRDACSINYVAGLPMRIYKDLLTWQGECSGFSRSEMVDALVKASCNSILPAISTSSLIAGKSLDLILASDKNGCAYSGQESDPETYKMQFGILIKRWRGNNAYWYWQYYRSDGSRAEAYMHKRLPDAIARVKRIGIPDDAKPQRLNKSKKIYQIDA